MDGEGSEGEVVAIFSEPSAEERSSIEVEGGGTTEVRREMVWSALSSVMLRRRGVGFPTVIETRERVRATREEEAKERERKERKR